jgi:peptidoglycan/xylan/chitin deacetylase (PgdA/CDA1 family)
LLSKPQKDKLNLKLKIINLLSQIKILNKYYSGTGTILMLHRVSNFETNKIFPNENLKVSPKFLDSFICNLKLNGYKLISIEELLENLHLKKEIKKQIVFTLDDGYLDNYLNAYPIFKKHNVPFTIYLCTGLIDRSITAWWHDVEDIISENDIIRFDNKTIVCKTQKEKLNAFFVLRSKILKLDKKQYFTTMNSFLEDNNINPKKNASNLFMEWEHVVELSNDKLVTIGSHTKNHFPLNQLGKKEIIDEVILANELIENKINKKVNHFAFPYGTINEVEKNEIEILNNLGFNSIVTTRDGNIYKDHYNFKHCLPRIMLTENFKIENIGRIRRRKIITI